MVPSCDTRLCQVLCVSLCLLVPQSVLAGGGSGLLLGLAKDGKLGDGGASDWDILIICMGVGAVVIFGSAGIHYLWKKHKKRKAMAAKADQEKAVDAHRVGAGRTSQQSGRISVGSNEVTPPPAYNKCVTALEDE